MLGPEASKLPVIWLIASDGAACLSVSSSSSSNSSKISEIESELVSYPDEREPLTLNSNETTKLGSLYSSTGNVAKTSFA